MLIKSIFATLLGAAVTGGAVYVAQNPEVLEPMEKAVEASTAQAPKDGTAQHIKPAPLSAPVQEAVGQPNLDAATTSETQTLSSPDVQAEPIDQQALPQEEPVLSKPDWPNFGPSNRQLESETLHSQTQLENGTFVQRVMGHASLVENSDLRDQAYLDIVDYALLRDEFQDANQAMLALNDSALRDTARNRIAIRHALVGDIDAAFDVIETVENVALHDFMRVQVIEALTMPQRLQQGVVPR